MNNNSGCYINRFSPHEREKKNRIWKVLCANFLQKYISSGAFVMDIGAGYCEFINNIKCDKKIALDVNPDTKRLANKDVVVINKSIFDIGKKYNNSVDVIFLSNFLEHLNSKDEVLEVLGKINELLKRGGRLILLQPNIDLVKEAYWDFIDHKVALNTNSIVEALEVSSFKIQIFIRRFLPYTTKSDLPASEFLIKMYLKIPQILRPFAGQSFAVAAKK